MTTTISPAIKGLITATVMIIVTFGLFYGDITPNSPLQYTPYIIYALGIVWTLVSYKQSDAYTGKFRDLFSQGFRCFIVVTLLMIGFMAIFLRMQPQFREENAKAYREFLVNEKSKQLPEIEVEVEKYRTQFNTSFISASIFGYLVIGAIVTAGSAAFITLTRRNQ